MMTAGVVTTAALVLATFSWQLQREPGRAMRLDPSIADAHRQTLPDGSTIELNSGTDVTVQFADTFRRVELRHGRAHFFVAKDPTRPFVVAVTGVEVRAVGTAFVVDLGARSVGVEVTEGRVMVEQRGEPSAIPAQLSTLVDAGSRVLVDLGPSSMAAAGAREDPDPATAGAAPHPPRIILSGTTLMQAIPLFNQHANQRLVIGDTALRTLQLSGVIRADNTTALLQLLADQFGISAERQGNDVVLRR
jgi:transmembrane sensor